MNVWRNRIGVITGAASGIGAAIVKDFLKAGVIVVGLDKLEDRMRELKATLPDAEKSRFHVIKCDVTRTQEVDNAFDRVISEMGAVDILVNNAGINRMVKLTEIDMTEAQEVIQTNVMAVTHCTQRAFKSMRERNFDGHIFFLNSISGQAMINYSIGPMNLYIPSKQAMTAMVEVFRQEFRDLGTRVKVTNVCPGYVDTEMVPDYLKKEANGVMLQSEDVSQVIMNILHTPSHVQIHDITIKAIGERM